MEAKPAIQTTSPGRKEDDELALREVGVVHQDQKPATRNSELGLRTDFAPSYSLPRRDMGKEGPSFFENFGWIQLPNLRTKRFRPSQIVGRCGMPKNYASQSFLRTLLDLEGFTT